MARSINSSTGTISLWWYMGFGNLMYMSLVKKQLGAEEAPPQGLLRTELLLHQTHVHEIAKAHIPPQRDRAGGGVDGSRHRVGQPDQRELAGRRPSVQGVLP